MVPRNILILLLEKVGEHLSQEEAEGENGDGTRGGEGRRGDESTSSSSPRHRPWAPSPRASALSAEFNHGLVRVETVPTGSCVLMLGL